MMVAASAAVCESKLAQANICLTQSGSLVHDGLTDWLSIQGVSRFCEMTIMLPPDHTHQAHVPPDRWSKDIWRMWRFTGYAMKVFDRIGHIECQWVVCLALLGWSCLAGSGGCAQSGVESKRRSPRKKKLIVNNGTVKMAFELGHVLTKSGHL